MLHQTIINKLAKNHKKVQKKSQKLYQAFSQQTIKQLRIHIKERKTFARFLSMIENTTLSVSKPVKKFYNVAWETRRRHISQKKFIAYAHHYVSTEQEKLFLMYCIQKELSYHDSLYKQLENIHDQIPFLFDNLIKKYISIPHNTIQNQYNAFKYSLLVWIQRLAQQENCQDDDIHTIRKQIKHLLYLWTLNNDNDLEDYLQRSKKLWQRNDHIELHQTLKIFNKQYKKEEKRIKPLRKQLKKTIKEEKKEILYHIPFIFTPKKI